MALVLAFVWLFCSVPPLWAKECSSAVIFCDVVVCFCLAMVYCGSYVMNGSVTALIQHHVALF